MYEIIDDKGNLTYVDVKKYLDSFVNN